MGEAFQIVTTGQFIFLLECIEDEEIDDVYFCPHQAHMVLIRNISVCVFEMTKRSGDLFVRSSSKVFFGWENFFFLTLRETQNHQMTNTRTRNAPVCPVINQSGQCEGREIHKLDPLGPSHHLICIEQMKPSKQALYYYTSTTKFGQIERRDYYYYFRTRR